MIERLESAIPKITVLDPARLDKFFILYDLFEIIVDGSA